MPEDLLEVVEKEETVKATFENAVLKKFRKLTKRNYLGVGYVHKFVNDTTQEEVFVPCTQAEYDSLSETQPSLEGHTWACSGGGTIKVDTSNSLLGDGEYTILPGNIAQINIGGMSVLKKEQTLPGTDVVNDQLEENKIIV